MKKQITSAFVLIITAAVMAGSQFAAAAQTSHLEVSVPFNFVVGDRELPAGRYRVSGNNESILRIVSADGGARVTVLTNASRGASKGAALTFRQYGDRHFLAGVNLPGAAGGRELQESKQERTIRAEPKTIALRGRG
jgi:hypothetical protein